MALSYPGQVSQAVSEVFEISQLLKSLNTRVNSFLETNTDLGINWLGPTNPPDNASYLNVDSDGNLDGFNFTPNEANAAIASFTQFQNLMNNQAVTQGDWFANVNKVADVNPGVSGTSTT